MAKGLFSSLKGVDAFGKVCMELILFTFVKLMEIFSDNGGCQSENKVWGSK